MPNIILIPAYKPDQRLISLIKELSKVEYLSMLVINNGNTNQYLNYFESISRFKKVSILNLKKASAPSCWPSITVKVTGSLGR